MNITFGRKNHLCSSYKRDLHSGPERAFFKFNGPKAPRYSNFDKRLDTFIDWPMALKQKPDELAKAGFYYIGIGDQVKCFFCDGGLKNWEPQDDPWEEHSKWFGKCQFLRQNKGEEFIKKFSLTKPEDSQSVNIAKQESLPVVIHSDYQCSSDTKTCSSSDTEKENRRLRDQRQCKVCYTKESEFVFVPCGHLVCCSDCASKVENCPVCRSFIATKIKTFMS